MDSHRAWTLLGAVLLVALLALTVPSVGGGGVGHAAAVPHAAASSTRLSSVQASTAPSTSGSSPAAPSITHTIAHIGVYTTPHTCGTITFNASLYAYGAVITGSTGAWPVSATPCTGWTTTSLVGSGGVQINGGVAYVNSTWGNISAIFTGPMYVVNVTTNPANCGSVTLNTTSAVNGQSITTSPGQFQVKATPCTGYFVSSLTGSGQVTITGVLANVNGDGGISATFQPRSVNVTVDSTPAGCGGATIGAVSISSGQTKLVIAGTYAYVTWGCTGYNLSGVSGAPSGIISPSPNTYPSTGNVTVLGDGFFNLSFTVQVYYVTFITQPGNGGTITFEGTTYRNGTTIQVPYGTVSTVAAVPLPYFQPTGAPFVLTGGAQWAIPQQSVFINGTGDIIAQFIPVYYQVVFSTNQNPCALSSVEFNASTFPLIDSHGARVKHGIYVVSNPGCSGFTFDYYTSTGNIAVTRYSGVVWVNGSGTVVVNFSPDWLVVSGFVEKWGDRTPIQGADVAVFYGGAMLNQTGPTGANGAWSVLLVYGDYKVNATAPLYTTSPQQDLFVNGTPTGVSDFVIWLNTTLGLPSSGTGVTAFVSTYPGILVPIGLTVVAVGLVLYLQMQRKWSRRAPQGAPAPPGAPGPGAPAMAPGPPARVPQLPPYGAPGVPPGQPPQAFPPPGRPGLPPPGPYGRPPGR